MRAVLLLLLGLLVPVGHTGLASLRPEPGRRAAQHCTDGLRRMRRSGDAVGESAAAAWPSLEIDEGSGWADGRHAEYKGRDVQALFDKEVRFGLGRVAVASERCDWDPIVNRTEDAEGAGEANASRWAGGLGAHSPALSAALENLMASDEDDAEAQEEDEYQLRLKIGRLKLDARSAYARGELEDARELYDACLELRPNDASVLANRAQVLLSLGRAAEAEEDCSVGIQVGGKGAPVVKLLYRRALARRERGRMAQALKDALEAADLEPRSPHIAKLINDLRQDEPVLRQNYALCSSNCTPPKPQPEGNACAPRADERASRVRGGEALLKWAGIASAHSHVSAPPLGPDIDDAQVTRVMDKVRCSRQEAREALFRCDGYEATAVDRLTRVGPLWLQRMGSRKENFCGDDDSMHDNDKSTSLDTDASSSQDVSRLHGAGGAEARELEETLEETTSASDDGRDVYDRSTDELYRDTRERLHAPHTGARSGGFGLAGEEALVAHARDVPVPTLAQLGPALARQVVAYGVDAPQLVPITPAVLCAEGRGGDASNAKGGEGAEHVHVRAVHTGEVIVCRSPLADSLPADALRELHRYAESDDVVSAGLDANQRAFMAAVRGDACVGQSVCGGQSSSASAIPRREKGVAAGSGRRAGVGSKSVTGFDRRVEVEEDPFEVAPPEVDTTLLHRAATLDEMGLHSSRARYSRGKAVPRFWYLNDAAGAIPDHVYARESMQSRIADSVRYEHMTVDSLKLLCKRRQLKVSGTKHELIRKLIQPQPSDRIPPPHPPPAADQGSSISDRVRGERDPANKGFQGHELPSMDFVPSQVARDMDRRPYEGTPDSEGSAAFDPHASSDPGIRPLSYREGERDQDEDADVEVARDHDTPWTVMDKKEMQRLMNSSTRRQRDHDTQPAQRPQRVIAEADFERVLGKRKAEELQSRHQQAQLEPELRDASVDASLRYYMGLAGRAAEGMLAGDRRPARRYRAT